MIYSPDGKKKAYVRLTADHDALDVANKVCFLLNITCSYFRYSLGVLIMNCVDRLVSSKLCSVIFRLPFRIGLQCLAAPPVSCFPLTLAFLYDLYAYFHALRYQARYATRVPLHLYCD